MRILYLAPVSASSPPSSSSCRGSTPSTTSSPPPTTAERCPSTGSRSRTSARSSSRPRCSRLRSWLRHVIVSTGSPPSFRRTSTALGQVTVFNTVQNYYIDSFSKYAASAIAAGSLFRSLMGGVVPLFAPQLFKRLGYGWGICVFAFASLAIAPSPLLFYHFGGRLRERFHNYHGALSGTREGVLFLHEHRHLYVLIIRKHGVEKGPQGVVVRGLCKHVIHPVYKHKV
jgi:hypothetical protein